MGGGLCAVVALATALLFVSEDQAGADNAPVTVYWLFAHPDDETIAAGASIAEHVTAGMRNVVVILTDGAATGAGAALGIDRPTLVASREAEARAALAHAGVRDVRFLRHPDGTLTARQVRAEARRLLRTTTGSVRFKGHARTDDYGFYGTGGHPDHYAVAEGLHRLWRRGTVTDLRQYLVGPTCGGRGEWTRSKVLTEAERTLKQRMVDEYFHVDPAAGRHGVGGRSATRCLRSAVTAPELLVHPERG